MRSTPNGGLHYPASTGDLLAWFRTDADCLDYLEWLRWPDGFVCPHCGRPGGWRLEDARIKCGGCGARTSVTAGTIFDRTRTPLTVWFMACWLFATQKDGLSAQSLQRTLEIGSYQTAWAMLHRVRSVLVRPGRERLAGMVEVDETYIGGEEPGLRGGRARGKKALVGVCVELREPKGYGRCRMAILPDASGPSLRAFLTDHVEPGAAVITDGWAGYQVRGGIDYAIAKSLAAAPFADLLWMETKTADLHDAKRFADAIHAVFPGKMLAYNLSPSFNWDTTGMDDEQMRRFPEELGKMGFVFNFITYGGHQIDGLASEEFATALRQDGMLALARLQRKFRLLESGYRTPQTLVGG